MPDQPFLIATFRTHPEHTTSPPQVAFSAWLIAEGIDRTLGQGITVWDETPIRAVVDVYDLNEFGDRLDPPTTTPQTITVSTLPPMRGVATGDPTI